ncbi:MAG: hypothetical protein ACRD4D_09015 [Candidatus Acidiferrales bacterium]
MSQCPECGATMDLDADELEEGAIISCPECSVDLEVVNTHPLELDVIGDEEDDDADADESEEKIADEDDDLDDEEDNGFH